MMKFLILASFVLLCTATPVLKNKNISIGDDGSIVITSPYGPRVYIRKQPGLNGEKDVEISVSGPNIPTKTIQVRDPPSGEEVPSSWSSVDSLNEEWRSKRGSVKSDGKSKSQTDVLSEIVKEYQGVVTEAQYEKLLSKINKAVKKGEVSSQIYDLLENLDQQSQVGGQYSQGEVQGLYGVGTRYGSGYGSVPLWYTRVPQSQYQQYSQLPLYDQSYGTSRYVSPLERVYGTSQGNYVGDLLASQYYGSVPSKYWSRYVGEYPQVPYGQDQRVVVPQVYGQQVIGQSRKFPQTVEQQQQQQQQQQQPLLNGIEQPQELRTIPFYRQWTGVPQTLAQYGRTYPNYYSQPLYRGYPYRQPVATTVPQGQLMY